MAVGKGSNFQPSKRLPRTVWLNLLHTVGSHSSTELDSFEIGSVLLVDHASGQPNCTQILAQFPNFLKLVSFSIPNSPIFSHSFSPNPAIKLLFLLFSPQLPQSSSLSPATISYSSDPSSGNPHHYFPCSSPILSSSPVPSFLLSLFFS